MTNVVVVSIQHTTYQTDNPSPINSTKYPLSIHTLMSVFLLEMSCSFDQRELKEQNWFESHFGFQNCKATLLESRCPI